MWAWMLLTLPAELPPKMALRLDRSLAIVGKTTERLGGEFEPLEWCPNGRYLVVQTSSGRLALIDTIAATKITSLAQTDFGGWDPTGRFFVAGGPDGIVRVTAAAPEAPLRLLPVGRRPSLSPDGLRIAFVRPDGNQGLWVAGADGSEPRRALRTPTPTRVQWSPDGRQLAFLAPVGGRSTLHTVRPNGTQLKMLNPVTSDRLRWSPGGSRILIEDAKTWKAIGLNGVPTVDLGPAKAAAWTRARKLLILTTQLREATLSGSDATFLEVKLPISEPATGLAAYNGFVVEGREQNPFANAPTPQSGQLRLHGVVQTVDAEAQSAEAWVDSYVEASGREVFLATPVRRTLSLAGLRSLRVRSDSEFVAIVEGVELGSSGRVLSLATEEMPLGSGTAGARGIPMAREPRTNLDPDGVTMDRVTVPIIFPVLGKSNWSDTFLAPRGGGTRRHHGQDVMAPKMAPLVAAFDGVVSFRSVDRGNAGIMLTLEGDNGFRALYIHVNNDTPGTDDGQGGSRYAFAAGLRSGDRVVAGQLIGFVGDSGNAESTAPHLHFELHDAVAGGILNASDSLRAAEKVDRPIYLPPAPELRPESGEVRQDGEVVRVDLANETFEMELIATLRPGGPFEVNLKPTLLVRRFEASGVLGWRGATGRTLNPNEIRPGMGVTYIGPADDSRRGRLWFDLRP